MFAAQLRAFSSPQQAADIASMTLKHRGSRNLSSFGDGYGVSWVHGVGFGPTPSASNRNTRSVRSIPAWEHKSSRSKRLREEHFGDDFSSGIAFGGIAGLGHGNWSEERTRERDEVRNDTEGRTSREDRKKRRSDKTDKDKKKEKQAKRERKRSKRGGDNAPRGEDWKNFA